MTSIETFSRDLDWLMSCPSLINSSLTLDTKSLPDEPSKVDFTSVRSFLESRASYRVGYYVESLVEVWLKKQEGLDQLEHGLQIISPERTLGELDFLYRLNGVLNHLEVALKFYLYESQENNSGSHFVGPNSADTFEKKRNKLLQRQIPMGCEHFPEIEVSRIMMKGMIFYPPGVTEAGNLPEGLNSDHRRGIWIRESERGWLSAGNGFTCGIILKKPFWLSGISPEADQQIPSIDELRASVKKHFQEKRHPLFVSLGDAAGEETARVFIVSDAWPDGE